MHGIDRPLTIFITKKPFNDHSADDMQCGDMDEKTLKSKFHLHQVSSLVDWSTFHSPYDHPALRNLPAYSKEKVIAILFDELRNQSRAFSFIGTHQGLITKLINHMQYKNGADYRDLQLDQAYNRMILNDKSDGNILTAIQYVLSTHDFNARQLSKESFIDVFSLVHLPKFVGWQNCINGPGISVHDINSTEIIIESIVFQENRYTATIHFKAQDHFGLDQEDISKFKFKFNTISFFRIWFVLQRYCKFSYKPFFTNFNARITISGENNA
ncbi:conserved hypothetical protein [Kosakonia oryzendophytica]|uniref:DUF3289 family protein n=1 Tax=Kosakonia oryzendophytica TaxID=1005665 RepID=A0A1C4B3F6_9ENTR|nr:DUF3289 family protein [Kosakonia oryzendophytica]SCC01403.1 conserved hypothetical protein [Kosakonia oryzendophytica]